VKPLAEITRINGLHMVNHKYFVTAYIRLDSQAQK